MSIRIILSIILCIIILLVACQRTKEGNHQSQEQAPSNSKKTFDTLSRPIIFGSPDSTSLENSPLWMRGGRSGQICQITFIENGKYIVTRAEDISTYVESVIRIHEFSSGKLVQTLRFIGSSSAVSHNGLLLASEESHVDYTHDLHIWNLRQGIELRRFAASGAVYQIVFSADDKMIAGCGRHGFVSIWEVETGKKLTSYQGFTEDIQYIMFSPDDKLLIAKGGESKQSEIKIWDTKTGDLKSTISTNYLDPLPLAISPNGVFLAYGETAKQITLMEFATGKTVGRFSAKDKYPQTLSFSPDSKMLLLGSDGFHDMHTGDDYENTLLLWRTNDTTSQMELTGHSSDVHSSAFTPDCNSIVCGLDDGSAPLWDVKTGAMLRKDVNRIAHIKAASFSLDGKSIITFGSQGAIHSWDITSGDSLSASQYDGEIGYATTMSLQKHLIATCKLYEGVINLVSTTTGELVRSVSLGEVEIRSLNFSNDGSILISSGSDGNVCLWHTETGKSLHKYKTKADQWMQGTFSPDNKRFAASIEDRSILVWDINSEKEPIRLLMEEHHYPRTLKFSPDGKYLAASYLYGPIRIWNIFRGTIENTLVPEASSLTYSPDGNYLAASDIYGTVNIWNTKTFSLVAKLNTTFKARYEMLQWSADRKYLLALTRDGAVAVWNVPELIK